MLVVAVGSVGAFLEIFLPQQLALTERMESSELQKARQGTAGVNTSVASLWNELAAGSVGAPDDQLLKELALAKAIQRTSSDALAHVQAAQAYLTQAEAMPFQLHSPGFVAADRVTLQHLQSSLTAASRLAGAASLQLPIAQSMNQNLRTLAQLDQSLAAHDWAGGARTAATLSAAIRPQQGSDANPETLLDPLWARWIDATETVVLAAQQYCLAAAQNQAQLAQEAAASLAGARNRMTAAYAAAQANASAWQAKTVQPLLATMSREAAAAA